MVRFAYVLCISILLASHAHAAVTWNNNAKDEASGGVCDPNEGSAYIFDNPDLKCVTLNIPNGKKRFARSVKKDEKAFPAYFQLKAQAAELDLPRQFHLYEGMAPYHQEPNFHSLPACSTRRNKLRFLNEDLLPAPLPEKLIADTSVSYGGGSMGEQVDVVINQNLPIGMACLGGEIAACNSIVQILEEAADSNRLQFGTDYKTRDQTAFTTNNHILLPLLNFYSHAIPKSTVWDEEMHQKIGKWLSRVIKDSDEYHNYGFAYDLPGSWQEMKSLTNHDTMQAATRMAYGILWQDKERVVEGLNLYKYRLETIRDDGSMPSETRRGAMALNYQNVGMFDIVIIAEMAASIGIDLYSYQNKRGQTIHDMAEFVVRAQVDESLIAGYAAERHGEGWGSTYWPGFVRESNFIGSKGTWYHLYKKRFPEQPIHQVVDADETDLTFIYKQPFIETVAHPTVPGANALCLAERPVETTPKQAQTTMRYGQTKRVWDAWVHNVRAESFEGLDFIQGELVVSTMIKQLLPFRDFKLIFQFDPETPRARFAFYEGTTNDGNLDSKGVKTDLGLDSDTAAQITENCGSLLYMSDGVAYPTFMIEDIRNTTDKSAPITGLSDEALCQIRTIGRHGYVDMVHLLSLVMKGVKGEVEDKVHFDNAYAQDVILDMRSSF